MASRNKSDPLMDDSALDPIDARTGNGFRADMARRNKFTFPIANAKVANRSRNTFCPAAARMGNELMEIA